MKTSKKKLNHITKEEIYRAVSQFSKMEGIDFERAIKNKEAIRILKQYGRAFSIDED